MGNLDHILGNLGVGRSFWELLSDFPAGIAADKMVIEENFRGWPIPPADAAFTAICGAEGTRCLELPEEIPAGAPFPRRNRPGPLRAMTLLPSADSIWISRLPHSFQPASTAMTLTTILLIILVLVLIGGVSTKGYGVGHGLNGGIGLILVILLVLYFMGKI
jgi:hypothetical protein